MNKFRKVYFYERLNKGFSLKSNDLLCRPCGSWKYTTYESTLNGTTTLHVDDESFGSILLIEGSATIENDGTTLEVNKGDSVFVDANSGNVKITGNCQWIYSRV